jgi:glycosyltransferase involved in cell wall biosynthesis
VKYWLLTSEYPPFFGGGISTYCYNTAKMLTEGGHEVSIFINDESVRESRVTQEDGIRVIRFNPSRTNSSEFLGHVTNISYEFAFIVKAFIEKEGRPDIIEAQEYLGIAYYLLQFKKLLYDWCKDVPILITAHSPSFLYLEFNHVPLFQYPNYWIGEMERFCLRAADQVVYPSRYLLKEVSRRFDSGNVPVSVVPNPFRVKDGIDQIDVPLEGRIVFFGKLSAQKGTFKLLTYFKQLWDEGSEQVLYLVGGTDIVYHPRGRTMGDIVAQDYRGYIEKGVLVMEGKIAPARMAESLKMAKVVIIPSTVDNLPYAVLEMMSLGKILLVSAQGGQAEIVSHGFNGFIFDHADSASFFNQLKNILSLSATELTRVSNNARQTVLDKYSYATIYQEKIGVMQSCLRNEEQVSREFPFLRQRLEGKFERESAFRPGVLSVVVPYYNMGDYIDETIQSLEESGYPSLEILIINDGSTGRLDMEKLDNYRARKGITVYDIPNGGLAGARNFGAGKALGEFMAFLDADDKIGKGFYDVAIKVLRKYDNVHFAGGWTQYFGGSTKIWPTFSPEPPIILFHNTVNSSALVYKRSSFLLCGINDPDMPFKGWEDYASVISMVGNGLNGVMLPEVFFYYRVRNNSMVRGINKAQKLVLYEYIARKECEFFDRFGSELSGLLNVNGPQYQLDNATLDYDLAGKLPFGTKFSQPIIALIKKNKAVKALAYKVYRLLNK